MNDDVFAAREGYLISLAAAVAAGCVPCAGYYVERARAAGVGDDEMRGAVADAESVRRLATDDCVQRVRRRLGDPDDGQAPFPEPAGDDVLLRRLAAAYAVNSHALVARLLDVAGRRALPAARLLEAGHIARGIRGMAIAIVERGLEQDGTRRDQPGAAPPCACG